MNLKQAREIARPGRIIEVNKIPPHEPQYEEYLMAKGYLECLEQVRPLLRASQIAFEAIGFALTGAGPERFTNLEAANLLLREALSQWDEAQK